MSLEELLAAAARDGFVRVHLEGDRPILREHADGTKHESSSIRTSEILESISPCLPPELEAELALGECVRFALQVDEARWEVQAQAHLESVSVVATSSAAGLAAIPLATDEFDDADAFELPIDDDGSEILPSSSTAEVELDVLIPWVRAADFGGASESPDLALEFELQRGRTDTSDAAGSDWLELDTPSRPFGSASVATLPSTDNGDSTRTSSLVHVLARPPVADRAVRDSAVPPSTDAFGMPEIALPESASDSTSTLAAVPALREFGETPPLPPRHFGGDAVPADVVPPGSATMFGLPPGALCFVPPRSVAEVLRRLGTTSLSVGDGSQLGRTEGDADVPDLRRLLEQPDGSCVVVRAEDPSRWLAFCLRRLEEGYRVLVETRALSLEGARRSLLGTDASMRAEAWLDQHPLYRLVADDPWRLESRGKG